MQSHQPQPSDSGSQQDGSERSSRARTHTKGFKPPASNRTTKKVSPTSKKVKANVRARTTKHGTAASTTETDNAEVPEPNTAERQDLSSRGLSIVPAELFELVRLRRLILSENNLSEIPSGIHALINLEYLDISRNPLRLKDDLDDYSCIPREISSLKKLHTLLMAEDTLKHIPVAIWDIASLQSLDLSRNKVSFIPGEIGNLAALRHLRLSQMNLDTLPPEIGFCNQLRTIDLTGNAIDSLPETMAECRQLYQLKINYRTFHKLIDTYIFQLIDEGKIRSEHIPSVVFELEGLLALDLNHARINTIPSEHQLIHLSDLCLSNNSFSQIPEALGTMKHLKILDMSHNRLNSIPEYLTEFQALETFNLSHNRFTCLSSILARVPTLKNLLVSHNQIDTIDSGFSQSSSLLKLDLSYNHLKILPDDFSDLTQLETLDLRYNQLDCLPLSSYAMVDLQSMNTFDAHFQRFGLHLLGNTLTDLPTYTWKTTNTQALYTFLKIKEKMLSPFYYHLKLIILGPKNTGKTTLTFKLMDDERALADKRETVDLHVSILETRRLNSNDDDDGDSDRPSSIMTDYWIDTRISADGKHSFIRSSKIKRPNPPPLQTYRSEEKSEYLMNKCTLVTKNNLFCTILDLKSEPGFEILYPLIYDSNALYLLPVNLTRLVAAVQTAASLNNGSDDENPGTEVDYNVLLTDEWLHQHVFRFIQSISDHCQQVSVAIIGLDGSKSRADNRVEQQRLLDEIHAKVSCRMADEGYRGKNIRLYSDHFSQTIHFDDENMSSSIIEKLEVIAQQWNRVHCKHKRLAVKRTLGLMALDSLVVDDRWCSAHFERAKASFSLPPMDDNADEHDRLIKNEIQQMNLHDCLEYLRLTGDLIYGGSVPTGMIIVRPYYLFNQILSRTLFRPRLDQWLDYDENIVFHFTGYYPTRKSFEVDRQRLLTRGECTWKMLNVLFFEQNNHSTSLSEEYIIDCCRLMQQLQLGYVNESNTDYQEFTTVTFVCPWFMREQSLETGYDTYLQSLERTRVHDRLRCERTRRVKHKKLWLALLSRQEYMGNDKQGHRDTIETLREALLQRKIPDLPSVDQVDISDSHTIHLEDIETVKLTNEQFDYLPEGLYERLLICLHPLFHERLDYYNVTLGRTLDKNVIQIERFPTENHIRITTNRCLLTQLRYLLITTLFTFYPGHRFQIET